MPPDLAALDGSTAHQHLGGYYGMVKRLDEALGRLLDALKSLNLLANTVVLFTSDHGCHFKTRNNEYKRSCHESSVRVPTAFQGPGFDGGGRVQELVSLIDLPPTLLDAAGIPVPEGMQGRSIMPLLRWEKVDWPEEVFIQISEAEVGRAVRTRRWKYGVIAPHKDGWHDSVSDRYVEAYLYDLQADPYELTNLIGMKSHQEATAVLQKRLLRRLAEAGEAIPTIELAPARDGFERKVKPEDIPPERFQAKEIEFTVTFTDVPREVRKKLDILEHDLTITRKFQITDDNVKLGEELIEQGWRLSCQTYALRDITIYMPTGEELDGICT